MPGYRQCKCGKIWNSYVIGTGPDTRTASPEMFIAREIPVRDDVIVASRRLAAEPDAESIVGDVGGKVDVGGDIAPIQIQPYGPLGTMPGGAYSGIAEGVQNFGLASRKTAYDQFSEWETPETNAFAGLMDGVDDSDEANMARWYNRFRDMRRNPNNEYRAPDVPSEWADENGLLRAASLLMAREADSPDVVAAEFEQWLMTQGTSLEAEQQNPRQLQNLMNEFLNQYQGGSGVDDPSGLMQMFGFRKGAPFAGYDDFEQCEQENADKRDNSAYCGEIKHRTEDKHAFTNTTGPWTGKTPGGPQGPGVGGLKQKTRYKSVSTPQLRSLRQRLMTSPQRGIDMNELLRELSFREVLGALHDITAPGATEDSDGTKTKRTDPSMSAPIDWSRRRSDGKWTRGDGHVTARMSVEVPS